MVENRNSNQPQNKSSNESNCSPACLYCNGPHYLYACENRTKLSVKDRYMFLKTKGLCCGCLENEHMKTLCRNKLKCLGIIYIPIQMSVPYLRNLYQFCVYLSSGQGLFYINMLMVTVTLTFDRLTSK